jgi:ubiquinone/menaquinone biosynthesis C-methylase UbiE
VGWFRKTADADPLAVSMAGLRLGDRLLVVGCSDPKLIASLAVKTGLTGRACAIDEDRARATSAQAITEREGALVETFSAPPTMMPLDAEAFDVVVIRDVLPNLTEDRRAGCMREVLRVLRGGGRCLVIDHARRGGLAGLIGGGGAPEYSAVETLQRNGLKAARVLAERDGLAFAEAVKPA